MSKRKTTEQFVEEMKELYHGKYDFSCTEYINVKTPVEFICPVHGVVKQRPDHLLLGHGCPMCGRELGAKKRTKSLDSFLAEAHAKHGDYYDYSLITEENYINRTHIVQIICPKHGVFEQTPYAHLNGGCIKCGLEKMADKQRTTREKFIEQATKVHQGFYLYGNVGNVRLKSDVVVITCPKHGDFEQIVSTHLRGHGCPQCGKERWFLANTKTLEQFKDDMRAKWGDEYGLDLIDQYKNSITPVPIICYKHGVFYKTPNSLLMGHGCSQCKRSWGEKSIANYLNQNGIEFLEQYPFPNNDLFCSNKRIVVDFYIPTHNIVIEFNGKQHYEEIEGWRGIGALAKQQARDDALRVYCHDNGIKLIEIPYTEINNIDKILDGSILKKGGRF